MNRMYCSKKGRDLSNTLSFSIYIENIMKNFILLKGKCALHGENFPKGGRMYASGQ